jgi:hypothetical protein
MTKNSNLTVAAQRTSHNLHNDVEATLLFSPLKTALQNKLSKSMAHLWVLNVLRIFSTFTGETALSKLRVGNGDKPVSCS